MAVFEKVQEIIVEELGKDASEVTLESTLMIWMQFIGLVPSNL